MSDTAPRTPYGSAWDLPSVKDMKRQADTLSALHWFLRAEQRTAVKTLRSQLASLVDSVDKFYELLGDRNWIFTGDLNVDAVQEIVTSISATDAEERILAYYREPGRIEFPLRQLRRFKEMRPRMELLSKALADFRAGRYYSTVLVLLTVLDGFVNEIEVSRKRGLHARSSDEMIAWDSVVGHHLGLSHAHRSFVKGFYKTDTGDVSELYRNGIIHGALVNFDNEVVAAKAWNRLFAVADWAEATEKSRTPTEPDPTFRQVLSEWSALRKKKIAIESWRPYEYEIVTDAHSNSEVVVTCAKFLDAWRHRRWGHVAEYFIWLGGAKPPRGQLAKQAKDLYSEFALANWRMIRARHTAAAVAFVEVELEVNGVAYGADLRWVRVGDDGTTRTEWEDGSWQLSKYGPSHFIGEANRIDK